MRQDIDNATKAKVAKTVKEVITERGMSQTQAAKQLGLKQPDVSLLLRGRLGKFSLQRLLEMARDLGCDIHITIGPSRSATGKLSVACE
jgi:predicted XRE-type DNA-binding protein